MLKLMRKTLLTMLFSVASFNLFLRVGDLSLVENERFTVCENAFVHVVHIHLTHRRSILNDLSRLNVLDVIEPPDFFIGFHRCFRPPLLRYYI